MDPFFEKISFLKHLQSAYDSVHGSATPNDRYARSSSNNSRKRGRGEWEEESNDELFKEIYQILINEDTFATLRTLLMAKFHSLVASGENNEYYQQVLNIIVDFRFMVCQAERMFLDPIQQCDFYYYVVDDINTLLKRSKHPILLFHLSQPRQ